MPLPSWHPAIALADLRTRQVRLAEAEQLLLGKEAHLQALLPAASGASLDRFLDVLATTPDAIPPQGPSHAEFTAMLEAMQAELEARPEAVEAQLQAHGPVAAVT